MHDTQRKYDTDKAITEMFAKPPTFLEKCLTCKHYAGCDKEVGDQLCGADKDNIVTCLSVEIEMQMAKLSGCVMFEEIR